MKLRKLMSSLEELHCEQNQALPRPLRRAIAAAVLTNPFAGQAVHDLSPLYELGAELGFRLTEAALAMLGSDSGAVQSYGKGAVVGMAGELEHAAAVLHPRFGASVRQRLGHAKAMMPSTAKRGSPGVTLDIPLHNVVDLWSFDHFDTVSLAIADAPGPDELLIALAFADGGRPLARISRPA